jgi:hypothetical protein
MTAPFDAPAWMGYGGGSERRRNYHGHRSHLWRGREPSTRGESPKGWRNLGNPDAE